MSKRTQLLNKLKHVYSHNAKLVLDVSNDDIGLIIEGVEKQIRKKPKDIETFENPYGIPDEKYGFCPICDMDVREALDWCPYCGNRLDWSEADE